MIKDDKNILKIYEDLFDKLIDSIDKQNINFYVNFIQEQLFSANKYFNDQEPWKKKDDQSRLNTILYVSLELIRKISILLYPIIPNSSLKALKMFNIKEDKKFNSASRLIRFSKLPIVGGKSLKELKLNDKCSKFSEILPNGSRTKKWLW